jgi:hypothetical protein
MSHEVKRQWMARILGSGLDNGVITPAQVIATVTPKHLATHLPPEVMAALLQRSLEAGELTPENMIEGLGAEELAAHFPFALLWQVVSESVDAAILSAESAHGEHRAFLGVILASALDVGVVTAADCVEYLTPALVMEHAPLELRIHILEKCLELDMTPELLVAVIGPMEFAKLLPVHAVWEAICTCDFEELDLNLQVMDLQSTVEPSERVSGRVRRKITPAATRRRRAGGSRVAGK